MLEQAVPAVQDWGGQLASAALARSALSRLLFYFPCQVALFHPFVSYLQVGSATGHGWGMWGLICYYSERCDGERGKGVRR